MGAIITMGSIGRHYSEANLAGCGQNLLNIDAETIHISSCREIQGFSLSSLSGFWNMSLQALASRTGCTRTSNAVADRAQRLEPTNPSEACLLVLMSVRLHVRFGIYGYRRVAVTHSEYLESEFPDLTALCRALSQ